MRNRCLVLALLSASALIAPAAAWGASDVAAARVAGDAVVFEPLVPYESLSLVVTGPDGLVWRRDFGPGGAVAFVAAGVAGAAAPDGSYTWELRVTPPLDPGLRSALAAARQRGDDAEIAALQELLPSGPTVQSGAFAVHRGRLVSPAAVESEPGPGGPRRSGGDVRAGAPGNLTGDGLLTADDFVIPDDLIAQSSICTGFDCVNGEVFDFDTLRLKENSLRIHFLDTSAAGFPSNDWRLIANDSAAGGQNKFSIEDVTGARVPFTVEAGTPANSVYLDSTGNVGFGTATPVLDLHVSTGDTPALRLEQNSSAGFPAQTWDVAGNEVNFFVRDVTGGSRLPFRVRPGAPTSSVDISGSGNVGIGTAGPTSALHVFRTNGTSRLLIEEDNTTTQARVLIEAVNAAGNVKTSFKPNNGAVTEWQQNFTPTLALFDSREDGANEMQIDTSGNVTATSFNPTCDVNAKEGFVEVDELAVLERLQQVPIRRWRYKGDLAEAPHIGPTAQDFHAAFAVGPDEKHITTIDADGVALAAIQGLYRLLAARDAELALLRAEQAALAARLAELEAR